MKKLALVLACLVLFAAVAVAADIEMKSVSSTFLDKVGYDAQAKVLAIQMKNSSDVYLYQDVPQELYDDLLAAESKGGFYVKNVKGKFRTARK
ncbi:MAG TPA: KTSC domain-containing protein [Kiritimatiellia bacterium]|nr:KTSC domain-containing protein [Kiritimatiellia bacterium]